MYWQTCRGALALMVTLVITLPTMADYEAGQRALDAGQPAEALRQWRAAAAADDRRAMLALGRLQLQGLGVLQDYVEAHKWFNLAASRGEAAAAQERDALAERMTPQQVSTAQDRASAWRPAADETVEVSDADVATAPVSDAGPPRQTIHEAQVLLAELGYEPGAFDGVWGSGSARAYGEFLRDAGLRSGETLTPEALRAMRGAARHQRDSEALRATVDPATELEPKCAEMPGQYLGENHAECWEEIENRPKCYWWNAHYHSDGAIMQWSGQCDGRVAVGSGTLSALGGNDSHSHESTGTLVNGRMTGHWIIEWYSGSRYEGQWRDAKPHGHGTHSSADGDRYEGEWRDGKRHGHGTFTFASGSRYEGEYRDGKAHGYGTATFGNGARVQGEWRDGCVGGLGVGNKWMALGTSAADCGFE